MPILLAMGVLGAAYAFLNFIIRKDTLLSLPLAPMDILLTQLYGMLMVLNMFGIIVATCMIYNMEFKGEAIKKNVYATYKCFFHVSLQVCYLDSVTPNCCLNTKPCTTKNRYY